MRDAPQVRERRHATTGGECVDGGAEFSGVALAVAASSALIAAWIAAGSTGLLADGLRHALVWVALAITLLVAWPAGLAGRARGILAAAWLAAAGLNLPEAATYNVLAVSVAVSSLALTHAGIGRRVLGVAAFGVLALAAFRLAVTSIPVVWLAADRAGQALGWLGSTVSGQPLCVGASFAGIDFLVVMVAVWGAWLSRTAPPRRARAALALAAVAGAHLVYLVLLAHAPGLADALPTRIAPPADVIDRYLPPSWSTGEALRRLLPWNLPLAAAVLHAIVAGCMFRRPRWLDGERRTAAADQNAKTRRGGRAWLVYGPLGLAAAIPLVTHLWLATCDLSGRTVVGYARGYVSRDPPWEGRAGVAKSPLGILPGLVESLGGRFVSSAELSSADLEGADVLVVVHPMDRWSEAPDRLERIEQFVRDGGALVVLAEPAVVDDALAASSFNELLAATGMRVEFATAIAGTSGWQNALEPGSHPGVAGLSGAMNPFGLVESAPLGIGWGARPILVGRWGFGDPGSDAVLTQVSRFDAGERLGDLVLGAEQRVGAGRVAVLGDVGSLSGGAGPQSYEFAGRLLAYLAGRGDGPQAAWRQAAGLLGLLALMVMVAWRMEPSCTMTTAIALAVGLAVVSAANGGAGRVVPASTPTRPIACIDGAHLGSYSAIEGQDESITGLKLALERSGYLPIVTGCLREEQLRRAAIWVSIGPSRGFSAAERKALREFVEGGGVLVALAGADCATGTNELLGEFGLRIPPVVRGAGEAGQEPSPNGTYRAAYGGRDAKTEVVFRAAWFVECAPDAVEVITQDYDGRATAVARRAGRGAVLAIADGALLLDASLDPERTSEGAEENLRFVQWLLARWPGRAAEEAGR